MKTSVLCGSRVAQRQSIRLLTENLKSNNSFLWRQLTAPGPSPNSLFLSPECPQHYLRPSSMPRHTSRSKPTRTNRIVFANHPSCRRLPSDCRNLAHTFPSQTHKPL